jgi:hypothetical protein
MEKETKETAAEEIRDLLKKDHQAKQLSALITLLLFALVIGWCIYANNEVEADKKWCREAPAKDFVDQFEKRCAQYRYDPEIKERIERILSGQEK